MQRLSPDFSDVEDFSGRRHSGQAQVGRNPCTLIRPSGLRAVVRDTVLGTEQGQKFPWLQETEAGQVGALDRRPATEGCQGLEQAGNEGNDPRERKTGTCHDWSFLSSLLLCLFSRISFLTFLLSLVGVIEDLNTALHKPRTFLVVLNT